MNKLKESELGQRGSGGVVSDSLKIEEQKLDFKIPKPIDVIPQKIDKIHLQQISDDATKRASEFSISRPQELNQSPSSKLYTRYLERVQKTKEMKQTDNIRDFLENITEDFSKNKEKF